MITFVIVGHDEADTIGAVIALAKAACEPGDRVLAVDSASTDGTGAAARAAGAEVLAAPLGKGAAMRVGADAADTPWVCFLDADLTFATNNIPRVLAAAARRSAAPQVCGDFTDDLAAVLTNTEAFYTPLVADLFPEVADAFGSKPLTGFRAVRREHLAAPFPVDFGVEAHLNIEVTLAAGAPLMVDVGRFRGKMKVNRSRTYEITKAILDCAVRHGRLSPERRPAYEAWVDEVYAVAATYEPAEDKHQFRKRLLTAAGTPLPG